MKEEWVKLCTGQNTRWASFCSWASEHGVGSEPVDWLPWWQCFEAGAECEEREWQEVNPILT